MKQLESLDSKALVSSTLYYDKEELEKFLELFGKVEVIDRNLIWYLDTLNELRTKGKLDNLPPKAAERRSKLEKMIVSKMAAVSDAVRREKLEAWFNEVIQYECDLELSEELIYRYCWAEFVDRVSLLDKEKTDFKDKLSIKPIVPDLGSKTIKPMTDIEIPEVEIEGAVFPTGIPTLDNLVKMRTTNFVVIAARASMGKSLFMINQAVFNSLNHRKILFVSLEESETELKKRVYNHISHRPQHEIETVYQNFYVYTPRSNHPDTVLAEISKVVKEEGIELVFIDYLQLVKYPNQDDWSSLRNLTRTLKLYAVSENICLVTASQLSREADVMGASLSSLFGSSTIEADANAVLILEPSRKENVRQSSKTAVKISVAKNRSGAQGKIQAMIDYDKGHIID